MKKKPPICQVRISPDLAVRLDKYREMTEFKVSRTAFVEGLITRMLDAAEKYTPEETRIAGPME